MVRRFILFLAISFLFRSGSHVRRHLMHGKLSHLQIKIAHA